jgi:RNA 2',3'-cyclic 3'-phosphodiesterase
MNTENTDRIKQWRLFCAFELPETLRRSLAEHSRKVREAVPDAAASWSRPENIHLTVKFFGNVDQAKAPVISAAATRVAKEFSAIQIEVGKTGVFPRPSRPQVLWIGVEDASGALARLQLRLEDEFALDGFAKEERAFKPHLTIARIRRPHNASQLADVHLRTEFSPVEVVLRELLLFRSELSSKGSKYTAISRHRLER